MRDYKGMLGILMKDNVGFALRSSDLELVILNNLHDLSMLEYHNLHIPRVMHVFCFLSYPLFPNLHYNDIITPHPQGKPEFKSLLKGL